MRIALIGYGNMGRNHYRILSSMPGVELAAVCDPVETETGPIHHYSDVQEMLASERLDAAVICVPTVYHRDVARACIDHGIDILIEKPLASTEAEAQEIADAANAAGVRAAVGHVERFNPVVTSLIEELEGKTIYSIAITRVGPFPPRVKDVGVLVDLSVHDVDLIRFLTGGEDFAESRVFKSLKQNGDHEDNAVLAFRMENDIVASIITNWFTPFKKRQIEVATDTAYYEANLVSQELHAYSSYQSNSSYVVQQCRVHKSEPLRNELDAFVSYVMTGERSSLASLEDGISTLHTIHKRRLQRV
jgi:predicted dehydrogenase